MSLIIVTLPAAPKITQEDVDKDNTCNEKIESRIKGWVAFISFLRFVFLPFFGVFLFLFCFVLFYFAIFRGAFLLLILLLFLVLF